jgi:hypothetical protein
MLLVTYGGFGFHTVDIYERFGPDTATFFFKVRSVYHFQSKVPTDLAGNYVIRASLECDGLL